MEVLESITSTTSLIQPDYKSFMKLARQGNLVPVCATLRADLLTPVSAWLRLARRAKYSFLLESVEGGEHLARYTFLGCDPVEVFRYANGRVSVERPPRAAPELLEGDPVKLLRERMARYRPARVPGLPPLTGGAIGYFAYDMVRLAERIPARGRDDTHTDDAVLMFYLGLVAFDHVRQRAWIIRNVQIPPRASARALRAAYDSAAREIARTRRALERPEPRVPRRKPAAAKLRVTSNMTRGQFFAAVRRAKQYIRAGDIFQAVLSQRFSARLPRGADPFAIYRALREVNPSPYMFYLRLADTSVVGASPEMLIKVQGRDAFYRPIAGTRPRGRDDADDRRLAEELAADPKERAEHIMLVDLGRNDLGRACDYGSVRVADLMTVERYSHVMHLVSNLRGRLRAGVDCFDALMACFPAGTVSGAPKVRAMQIIDELEPTRRGIYAGAILYLDFSGNLDSCIAIRTLVAKNGIAHVQAGAGIVADSVPAREFDETVHKAGALLAALQAALK
jgi:anthranilate synthase component 1